jgi:RHS repeat-associated protein
MRKDFESSAAIRINPFTNWRGQYERGIASGGWPLCTGSNGPNCISVAWPAPQARTFLDGVPAEGGDWVGSLIKDQRDASGLLYRRNRYYDPNTGQFTQEDPIGVAGGMNLYGFAGGDPVNSSDPFGLMSCPPMCGPIPMPGPGALPIPMPTPQMMEDLGAALQTVASAVGDALDAVRDRAQIKFVTYTRANPATGQVYSGRTSGFGNPQSIVNARAGGHGARLGGFGSPAVDRWAVGAQGYAAVRGREQQLIDANGGAQSDGGSSANLIRGVSKRNPLAEIYDKAATATFGPPK